MKRVELPKQGCSSKASCHRGHRRHAKHACDACRARKKKCSAENSGCISCKEFQIPCVYSEGKRETHSKRFHETCQRLEVYDRVVRKLSHGLNMTVEEFMRAVENDTTTVRSVKSDSSIDTSDSDASIKLSDNCSPPSEVSFTNPVYSSSNAAPTTPSIKPPAIESLCRRSILDGGHTCFYEKTSPLQLSRKQTLSISNSEKHVTMLPNTLIDGYNPLPQSIANNLVKVYFKDIHPILPVFESSTFLLRYRFHLHKPEVRPTNHWLAILNYIFATAALYMQSQNKEHSDANDHQYFASISEHLLRESGSFSVACSQTAQAHLVGAFYYLGTNQIRQASEHADTAAAHMATLPKSGKMNEDTNQRLRSSFSYIENLLSIVTGWPVMAYGMDTGFQDTLAICRLEASICLDDLSFQHDATMPTEFSNVPGPHIQDMSNVASQQVCSYLYELDTVNRIAKRAVAVFYRGHSTPEAFQSAHWLILKNIEMWKEQLPSHLKFTDRQRTSEQTPKVFRARANNLACNYYSTVILITWPALVSKHQYSAQHPGIMQLADQCITAALQLISLLPNRTSMATLSAFFPWWYLDKYFVQATTVLTNEIAYHCNSMSCASRTVEGLQAALGRAVECLERLSIHSPTALKAQEVASKFLQLLPTERSSSSTTAGAMAYLGNSIHVH